MQRYLRPDVLDDAGITDFDSWAATFGEVTTDLELSPDGSRFRMQSRFAKFRNVPELLRMWHLSADIKTAEDLQLPTPALRNNTAETAVAPASSELGAFMRELSDRADKVQHRAVDPAEDNMLRIATHGRMAALDLRLLGRDPGDGTKILAAADRIAATYHANADRPYSNADRPGALQLVFSDLGTPRDGWNVYDELRAQLIARGVPAPAVRFVHEARNDREKGELFAACRNGRVSVLIGSTERMGVGTNVQARAVALHHLDCPWRPADIAQREGRVLRQGNLNPQVEIIRYVSEGSFDAYLWQTVERKARFIGQVMRGRLDMREIEDIGDTALSYSEVKALASGDPRILEKAKADSELNRLERLERSHHRTTLTLRAAVERADTKAPALTADLARIDAGLTRHVDTRGDHFVMTVGERRFTNRSDASLALRDTLASIGYPSFGAAAAPTAVGAVGGFTVLATRMRYPDPHVRLELADVPRSNFVVDDSELRAERPYGIVTRLENRAGALPATRKEIERDLHTFTSERARAMTELATPFLHGQALADARARSAQLAVELAESSQQPTAVDAWSTPATDAPSAPASQVFVTRDDGLTYFAGEPPRSSLPSTYAQPVATEDRPAFVGGEPPRPSLPATYAQAVTTEDRPASVAGEPPRPSLPATYIRNESEDVAHALRWETVCAALDPRVVADPHWPALVEALDRADAAGVDVTAIVHTIVADHELTTDHPARSLRYRLVDVCSEAMPPAPAPITLADPQRATPVTAPAAPPRAISAPRP